MERQLGMSLVETMIGMAMMLMMALAIAELTTYSNRANRNLTTLSEWNSVIAQVSRTIAEPEQCNRLFGPNPTTGSGVRYAYSPLAAPFLSKRGGAALDELILASSQGNELLIKVGNTYSSFKLQAITIAPIIDQDFTPIPHQNFNILRMGMTLIGRKLTSTGGPQSEKTMLGGDELRNQVPIPLALAVTTDTFDGLIHGVLGCAAGLNATPSADTLQCSLIPGGPCPQGFIETSAGVACSLSSPVFKLSLDSVGCTVDLNGLATPNYAPPSHVLCCKVGP